MGTEESRMRLAPSVQMVTGGGLAMTTACASAVGARWFKSIQRWCLSSGTSDLRGEVPSLGQIMPCFKWFTVHSRRLERSQYFYTCTVASTGLAVPHRIEPSDLVETFEKRLRISLTASKSLAGHMISIDWVCVAIIRSFI